MDNGNSQRRELESFFLEIGERLDLVARYEAKIARLEAASFSVFGSTYIDPDENKVTAILADLLNPKGSHCQGSVFLESFLTLQEIELNKDAIGKAVVQTEHLTGRNRRIDLTVWIDGFFLGLENKIDSPEHGNQVCHYVDFLSRHTSEWFFVFLKKDGSPPKECPDQWENWQSQRKVASWSYAGLSGWLRSCIKSSYSDRVRVMLDDMANWAKDLTGENVKTNPAEDTVTEFVLKHPEHFKTSIVVAKAAAKLRIELMKEFFKSLEKLIMDELDKGFTSQVWSSTPRINESDFEKGGYPGIFFRANHWKEQCWIGIQAERADLSDIWFGLHWPGADPRLKTVLQKALNAESIGKSQVDKGDWVWCPKLHYPGVEVGAGHDSEVLEAIHDNDRKEHVVRHFVERILRVASVVDKNGGRQEAA